MDYAQEGASTVDSYYPNRKGIKGVNAFAYEQTAKSKVTARSRYHV